METLTFNPTIGTDLMSSCVYATTYAKKNNCIIQMLWGDTFHSCNPDMTAAKFYDLIIYNLKRK